MISIRFKVVLLLVALIGVYTVAAVGITSRFSEAYLLGQAKEKLAKSVDMTEASIELANSPIETSVNFIADIVAATVNVKASLANPKAYAPRYLDSIGPQVLEITKNTKGVIGGYVYLNVDLYKGIYDVWYKLEDGKMVQTMEQETPESFYPTNDSMTWYFAPILEKKPVWTHIYYDAVLKFNMFSFVRPIVVDDVLVGMVGFDVGFTGIENMVQSIKIFDSGYAVLLDDKGQFITKPRSFDALDEASLRLVFSALKNKPKGTLETDKYFFGYSGMKNGQVLVVVAPKSEVLQPIIVVLPWLVGLLIGLAIVVVIVGSIFSGTVIGPIKQLEKFANDLRVGKFDKKVEVRSRDEVGKLAETFDNLRVSINEKNGELAEINFGLEEKIKERTAELVKKNEELTKINDFTVGRELKMIELKKEIEELRRDLAKFQV
jgi:methyl-accepting chemotaxis protein